MAKDTFHDTVKRALEKDGWTVSQKVYPIDVGGVQMEIDIAAERLLVAERGLEKIAVEVIFNPQVEEILQWIN